jgi:hypothetical protein
MALIYLGNYRYLMALIYLGNHRYLMALIYLGNHRYLMALIYLGNHRYLMALIYLGNHRYLMALICRRRIVYGEDKHGELICAYVVSCAVPVENVSWILFQERRSSNFS